MQARWSRVALVGILALASCDRLSQVGHLSPGTPTAAIATVAQPYTTDASGVVHTTVRAGADVVLTGASSFNGANDTGVPIITWEFKQLNPGNYPVDLIERTTTTYSFTAPQVTSETSLTFQLTVTSASGGSATAQAVVTVEPVRDADHFLTYLSTTEDFTVTAITSAVLPAAPQASYTYAITVTKLVNYTDLSGVAQIRVPVGAPVVYNGEWNAALGSGGSNCADARNPLTRIPIPRVNLDDMLYNGSGQSTGQRLSDVMQTANLDLASVEAQVVIAATSALPGGATAELCFPGLNRAASLTVSADDLLTKANDPTALFDTTASALAYYQTIDPLNAKTTLSGWLDANGFNSQVSGWAADAHAIYTNNYDLGLGRDMYMKVGACDSGFTAAPLSQFSGALSAPTAQTLFQLIGHCDVAAVVVNYASVQAATEHINVVLAVAMEYSATPGGGPRFTKFYVFAPNTSTGVYQRVASVDLDHRGQRSVPQSCVVCHGGTPTKGGMLSAGGLYPSTAPSGIAGDVNAGFLAWDLDSFWYSDTDPGFSIKPEDAGVRAQYTRANQLAQLKMLNVGAYLTTANPKRFALERELLEGWYGGQGLPGAFDGTFVPAGWNAANNGNPADSATIYTDVFQRQCRMCHIMQAPPMGVDPRTTCTANTQGPAAGDQVPMGCYWELAKAPNLAQRLGDGAMPFARRTADRLWVMPDGSPSAGSLLQAHFAAQNPTVTIDTPGTSVARFNPAPPNALLAFGAQADTGPIVSADIGNAVRLDATTSAFPDTVSWAVSACPGTPANPGVCQRALPVVGANSVLGWFILDDAITYQVSLTLDGGTGAEAATEFYQVPLLVPTFVSPIPTLAVQVGSQTSVSPSALVSAYGNGGVANNHVLLQAGAGLAVTPAGCTVAPGCLASSISGGFTLQSTGSTPGASSVTITVTGLGSNPQEVQAENVPVTLVASVQAPLLTLAAVAANTPTATMTNLLNAAGGAGAFPNCASVKVQSAVYQGARGSTSSFDANTQMLSYTPAAGFATYDKSGTVQQSTCGTSQASCAQETLTYQLACTLPNTQVETSNSTILIPVKARVSFSQDISGIWATQTPCDSCHTGGSPSGPPLSTVGYVELTTGFTDDMIAGKSWNGNHIPFVNLGGLPNLTTVDQNSALACWPSTDCAAGLVTTTPSSHTGGDLSADQPVKNIKMWIEDGANNF